jgi:hypothetical protein
MMALHLAHSTFGGSSDQYMSESTTGPPQFEQVSKSCLILIALLLSACATPVPPPPQIVHVSVPTPCLPSTPLQRPKVFTDPQLSALDDYKFTLAIFSDRRVLLDYSAELEAVLLTCK